MAVGLASAVAAGVLDALGNATNYSVTNTWIKLHVGDPGSAGTANAAVETDRIQASWGAASGGTIANDAPLLWEGVGGTEDYTHYSCWSASTAGTFQWSGTVTANAVTINDDFQINTGGLTMTVTVAT